LERPVRNAEVRKRAAYVLGRDVEERPSLLIRGHQGAVGVDEDLGDRGGVDRRVAEPHLFRQRLDTGLFSLESTEEPIAEVRLADPPEQTLRELDRREQIGLPEQRLGLPEEEHRVVLQRETEVPQDGA